jgi:hypothetical protein
LAASSTVFVLHSLSAIPLGPFYGSLETSHAYYCRQVVDKLFLLIVRNPSTGWEGTVKPAKRKGRPTKPGAPGTRVSLGLKVTPKIKSLLDQAAAESGRTQSQEAEYRLTQSFTSEPIAVQALSFAYGPKAAGLLMLIARAMNDAGRHSGFRQTFTLEGANNWMDVPFAYDQVSQAIARVVDLARPPGAVTVPPSSFPTEHELHGIEGAMGAAFVNGMISALADKDMGGELGEWAKPLRPLLGDLAQRMQASLSKRRQA